MHQVLARLFFIKFTQVAVALLLPLLILEGAVGKEGLVWSRLLDTLPLLIFGLASGVLLDRWGAERVNRIALALYSVPPVFILAARFFGAPDQVIIAASIILTCASYLAIVCGDRVVLDLIPSERLAAYNSYTIMIERICELVLPPLIGWVATRSLNLAVVVTAGFAIVGAAVLYQLSPRADAPVSLKDDLPIATMISRGFSSLLSNNFLIRLSVFVMLINATEAITMSYQFVYARETLSMSMAEIGLMGSFIAVGGIIGAMIARSGKRSRHWLVGAFTYSMFVNAALYLVIYAWPNKYVLMGANSLEACSFVFSAVAYRTLRQDTIDRRAFGVLSGALAFTVKAGMPFSIAISGAIMLKFGAPVLYLVYGTIEMALAFAALVWFKSSSTQKVIEA